MSSPGSRPAGWYPSPDGAAGMVRWWTGTAWGDMQMPSELAPRPPSTGDKVAGLLGNAAKAWFLLLLLVICVVVAWIVLGG